MLPRMAAHDPSRPTLYYDGACPVCAREIALYRRQPGAEALHWVDAARCEPAELGIGLSRQAALAALHLRQPDGSLVAGASAFAALWLALPRWRWLGRLFSAPAGAFLLEHAYRAFLALRPLWRRAQPTR